MTLDTALGALRAIPQFFVWRLTWLPDKAKYQKVPAWPAHRVDLNPRIDDQLREGLDAQNPKNWMAYPVATGELGRLQAGAVAGEAYALGFMFTEGCGFWFLDLDSCIGPGGELSEWAKWFDAAVPNALREVSSSGTGLHYIGRGLLPPHRTRPDGTYKGQPLELYSKARGVAFGLSGAATGCADADYGTVMASVAAQVFPADLAVEGAAPESGPRSDWRGPTDDGELLALAMRSRSTESKLAGKACFADLWNRNVPVLAKTYPADDGPYGESEADMALASHLAYWTGCDAERIERLMRQSALKRDKWDASGHRDYLRKFTIGGACGRQRDVYQQAEQKLDVSTTVEAAAVSTDWIAKVMHAEEGELRNVVIPGIAADTTIELLDRERLAMLVKQRLEVHQIPASIAMCRKMVSSARIDPEADGSDIPDFGREHVYIERGDLFFHIPTASELSRTAYCAKYNRAMPTKGNGDKEDAAKWSLERWGMATVFDQMYEPTKSSVFPHEGRYFANSYTPASAPEVAAGFTVDGSASINRFCAHLWAFVGARLEVYQGLIDWMAHNVQKPGCKIRFAPLLKGVPGDGKSIITEVLAAAMGSRNVSAVGPAIVSNSGGFTDWAHGACVIGLEEMMMTGRQRYAMANAIKENVTNSRVTINRKGKGPLKIINVSNFIGYTNFNDAIPLEDEDRRWWIIFSPYKSTAEMVAALGYANGEALAAGFLQIWDSLRLCPGEWRKWLVELPISPAFNPNGHAPTTVEKGFMRASGEDEVHAIARQAIEVGGYGVTKQVFSSSCLFNAMRAITVADGLDMPKTTGINNLYSQLGYRAMGVIKWQGKTHRLWSLGAMDAETARKWLDGGVTGCERVTDL